MLRFFTFGAIVITLASAFTLYAINYKTRRIASEVAAKKRDKTKLVNKISTLKAERAFLSRADRIAPLAEGLGMQPATGDQFITERSLASKEKVEEGKKVGGASWHVQQ